jgi:hypothetical protein
MQIRRRTSKSVARRHDLNYFKHPSRLRRWQGIFALAAVVASCVWLVSTFGVTGQQMLSSGPISSAHAVFGTRCESCHLPKDHGLFERVGFNRSVPDRACMQCHAVPAHQESLLHPIAGMPNPSCSSCHVEHEGSMMLAHTADSGCIQCHSHLIIPAGSPHIATAIYSFVKGHPQFSPLEAGFHSNQAIKFSHYDHLKHGLLGPHGKVTMVCSDCHRPEADRGDPWPYGSASAPRMEDATYTLGGHDISHQEAHYLLSSDHGRAYLAPTAYATGCHDCHTLRFDRHIKIEAPHEDPAKVRVFIANQIRSFALAHPQVVDYEIHNWASVQDVDPIAGGKLQAVSDDLTGMDRIPHQKLQAAPHNVQDWVTIRTAQAERRLWHKSCNLCHEMQIPDIPVDASVKEMAADLNNPATLPTMQPTRQPVRWEPDAVFSHEAHQSVSCNSCHEAALKSESGKDILLPAIKTCKTCHDGQSSPQGPVLAAGHAESGCFLCHEYHNWLDPRLRPTPARSEGMKELGVVLMHP